MIKVVADSYFKKEYLAEAAPYLKELVEKTRAENGCISYELFADTQDEAHLMFIETWENAAALDAHMKSEHFTRIGAVIGKFAAQEMKITTLSSYL